MEDKEGAQHLCVCVWVCVCVCEMGKEVGWMNRQHDGAVWQEVFLSVWFLEWTVKGVRNVWLLALAEEWQKVEVQRRGVQLKYIQA